MKYGLLVVKDTENIGDDIQAYAAMQFLPHVDYYIDREHLDTFVSENLETVKMIMNGWFIKNKWNWPPAPVIDPLLISMHFQREDLLGINEIFLQEVGGKYFSDHAIVGCRDTETQNFLQENKIDTYFSGCLTLTLQDKFDRKVDKPYCCITNCGDEIVNYVKEKRPDLDIKIISQEPAVDKSASWDKRFHEVEILLQTYQNAEFVVTTRLHCAMPCLALKTPVLFLNDETIIENDRFAGLSDLLYCESPKNFLEGSKIYDIENPPINKKNYLLLRNALIEKCKQFVAEEKNSFEKEWLLKKYEENAKWKEELLIRVQKNIYKQYNDLYDGKKWIEEQWEIQRARISELEKWCQELENGKKWVEEQWQNQKLQVNELEQCKNNFQNQFEEEKKKVTTLKKEIELLKTDLEFLKKSRFVNWLIKKNKLSI